MFKRKSPKNIILGTVLVSSIINNHVETFSRNLSENIEGQSISKFKDINKDELQKILKDKLDASYKREKFIYPQKQDKDENKSNSNKRKIDSYKKEESKNKNSTKVISGKVLTVTLSDGQYISTSLKNNPEEYETIVVTTTGSKKLVKQDYDNLRLSKIPKVDLSNAWSDSISAGAFANATHLIEFKFPQGITSIEGYGTNANVGAFYNCKNLIGELIIPNSVTNIGNYAFYGCTRLTGSLIIPNSVKTIGNLAFAECSGLTGSLIIPNSVNSIGNSAFEVCSGFNGSLTIGNNVTNIGNLAFGRCSGFTGELTIPNSVTTIGREAFRGCTGFNGSLTLSNSLTSIGRYAFYNCKGLTGSLTIPNGVTSIEEYTFWGCSGFTGELTLPNSLTSIERNAFTDCCRLTGSLTIPNSVTTIGEYAFGYCSGFTGGLIIPSSVISIGYNAFIYCDELKGDLIIPNSVTTIGYNAFAYCSGLTGYYVVPEHITSINDAFEATNVKVIIKVNESDRNSNYKEDLITSSNVENTYIDINSDLTIGTWIETSNYKLSACMNATHGVFDDNEGILSYLEINAPYTEENISITRNGQPYSLPRFNNGRYTFEEEGDYTIKVVNDWGTVINISFKNSPLIKAPEIQHIDGMVNIKDNGRVGEVKNIIRETFDDISNVSDSKVSFISGSEGWYIEDGNLKSGIVYNDMAMAIGGFEINSKYEGTMKIRMKCTTDTTLAPGSNMVMLQFNEDGETIEAIADYGEDFAGFFLEYQTFEYPISAVPTDVLMLMMDLGGIYNGESGQFMIDFIEISTDEIGYVPSEVIEYRINNGEWITYTGNINLDRYGGSVVQVDARARDGEDVSAITSKQVYVEISEEGINQKIEDLKELQQNSKLELSDISDVRDMINSLPESSDKDLLQDKLNELMPNISSNKEVITNGVDIYLKPKEFLEVSLNTNSIIFEEIDNTSDVLKEEAIVLTVSSSSPYEVNSSLVTNIQNADGTEILSPNILEIKTFDDVSYKPFTAINSKINLLDNQNIGSINTHKIDFKLNTSIPVKADVYKAVLKFEINQK